MISPTPCAEFDVRLPEYLDGLLAANECPGVAAHLATCPACRAFAETWRALDASLEKALQPPTPSPAFEAGLRRRLTAEAARLSPAEREAKKRAWETEFAHRTGAWRRRILSLSNLLDALGYGVLAAAFCFAAWSGLPKLIDSCHLVLPANVPQGVVNGVITGVAVLLVVGAAFWRPARRLSSL